MSKDPKDQRGLFLQDKNLEDMLAVLIAGLVIGAALF